MTIKTVQGYILGTVFAAVELWWLSIVFVLLIEVEQKKADEVIKR